MNIEKRDITKSKKSNSLRNEIVVYPEYIKIRLADETKFKFA